MSEAGASTLPGKPRIPGHLFVAGSAWISRIVIAFVQLASVRVLMEGLGVERYAVFALFTGLAGWYVLADMSIGASLQNFVSECRAKDQPHDTYMVAAGLLSVVLLMITTGALYLASPYLGPRFLTQFTFLSHGEKTGIFFMVGSLMISQSIGSIAYKVWYARQKGYWSNIVPAVATLVGFGGIILAARYSDPAERLRLCLAAFVVPTALFPMLALLTQFGTSLKKSPLLNREVYVRIIRRAGHFWFITVMATAVLQIDYVVMSQFLPARDITIYNISTKVFGTAFYMYLAILAALWPVFAEAIANGDWRVVKVHLKKNLALGLLFMAVSTLVLIRFMPMAVDILAPNKKLVVPVSLVVLLGIYYMLRVWTDTFSMVLQSMSELRLFMFVIPTQALLSIALQWILAPLLGLTGIVIGLIGSFILTASWALPLVVHRRYKASKQVAL